MFIGYRLMVMGVGRKWEGRRNGDEASDEETVKE